MKTTVKVEKEVNITTLEVKAGVRYWEDAEVNGVEDTDGTLIPCRVGDYWCPIIDIDSGRITNWTPGVTAKIHYKVCDNGKYSLKDDEGNLVKEHDGYVRDIMSPSEQGYGDYIIMSVDANGMIGNWNADIADFFDE